jgi:hypothetical protein
MTTLAFFIILRGNENAKLGSGIKNKVASLQVAVRTVDVLQNVPLQAEHGNFCETKR